MEQWAILHNGKVIMIVDSKEEGLRLIQGKENICKIEKVIYGLKEKTNH